MKAFPQLQTAHLSLSKLTKNDLPKLDIKKGEYTIEINIQHLTPAYYYVRYASETLMETFKFIKS